MEAKSEARLSNLTSAVKADSQHADPWQQGTGGKDCLLPCMGLQVHLCSVRDLW